jgi:hypothetical protein
MVNRSKSIGTSAESELVRWLHGHGFGSSERVALHGKDDQGDVWTRTQRGRIVWEVKAGAQVTGAYTSDTKKWVAEAVKECENSRSAIGVLVTRTHGVKGDAKWLTYTHAKYWASLKFGLPSKLYVDWSDYSIMFPLTYFVDLLNAAGWTNALDICRGVE